MLHIPCPACQTKLQIPPEMGTRRIRCSRCSHVFQPDAGSISPREPPPSPHVQWPSHPPSVHAERPSRLPSNISFAIVWLRTMYISWACLGGFFLMLFGLGIILMLTLQGIRHYNDFLEFLTVMGIILAIIIVFGSFIGICVKAILSFKNGTQVGWITASVILNWVLAVALLLTFLVILVLEVGSLFNFQSSSASRHVTLLYPVYMLGLVVLFSMFVLFFGFTAYITWKAKTSDAFRNRLASKADTRPRNSVPESAV